MKLGDVLRKERDRKKLTAEDVAAKLGISVDEYQQLEAGTSPAEEWGRTLAEMAIQLGVPTARLISPTGRASQAGQGATRCGELIRAHRERKGISKSELAERAGLTLEEMDAVENAQTALEDCAPLLLSFAEAIDQPIFNLFYPCGLPLDQLTDYP